MKNNITILGHFYNEEYLLPFWLNHHKKYFNHGILVDYNSTDNSVNIIKEICPTWEIIKTRNEFFDSRDIDKEIMDIERDILGYRICLNITEFLLGKFSDLSNSNKQYLIPSYSMVDKVENEFNEVESNLFLERTFGFGFSNGDFYYRRARSLHNKQIEYPLGRHFENHNTEDFIILWYGFSPFTERGIKRKLQIQNKMSQSDKDNKRGFQHLIDRDGLIKQLKEFQNKSFDISWTINKYINLSDIILKS